MNTATGTYFDGHFARGRPVTLEFAETGTLRVSGEGIADEIDLAQLRVSDRLGDIPRFLYLPNDVVIESPDNAVIDAALGSRRLSRAARFIHALESQQRIAAIACVLLVAVLATIGYYGPPALARTVAQRVPLEVDQRIGAAAMVTIRPYFHASTLSQKDRTRVTTQLARLRGNSRGPAPAVEFRSMNGGLPNAFALPGNVIIVTDELVRLPATDDEIAAVLAHELGHLEQRHGLQSLLRGSFAVLIVAAITGDLSALTSFASTIPLTLLNAGYSRDLEREADRHALELLRARGIKPHVFSTILLKLESSRESLPRNSTYLSTHPETDERTALFGTVPAAERNAFRLSRGSALLRQRDFRGADAEFTTALKIDPNLGVAYERRASARRQLGQHEAALADLGAALEHGIAEEAILQERGHLQWELGRYDDARRDFDRILTKGPNSRAYRGRGMLEFALANWEEADANLRATLIASPSDPNEYVHFFRHLARRRGKLEDQSAAFKVTVGKWPSGWAKSIGRYLSGQINETQLLADAARGPTPTPLERKCEAYFYIGQVHLLDGHRKSAEDYFQKCVATNVPYYYEYTLARVELARLQQNP